MPPKLSHVDLGAVGLTHVKNRLDRDKPLRRALSQLSLEDGEVWTWAAPEATFTLEDLRDASLPEGITQQDHWDAMTQFVETYLVQEGRLAIIEDHDSSPTDAWLADEPVLPPRLGLDKHLYWYATTPDRPLIADVTRWGFGLFKCMALARRGDHWSPAAGVTETDIQSLGRASDHFIVDAFDFEGFAVWSRRTSS